MPDRDRLADDLELSDDRILPHPVGKERLLAHRCIGLDVVDGVPDVPQVDALVLHSSRASAAIRGRRAGWMLSSVKTSTFRWSSSCTSWPRPTRSRSDRSSSIRPEGRRRCPAGPRRGRRNRTRARSARRGARRYGEFRRDSVRWSQQAAPVNCSPAGSPEMHHAGRSAPAYEARQVQNRYSSRVGPVTS
jgi:hypothetical protein